MILLMMNAQPASTPSSGWATMRGAARGPAVFPPARFIFLIIVVWCGVVA